MTSLLCIAHTLATKDIKALQSGCLLLCEISVAFHVQLVESWEEAVRGDKGGETLDICSDCFRYRTRQAASCRTDHLKNIVADQNISLEIDNGKTVIAWT
jgi:hypothetical protein